MSDSQNPINQAVIGQWADYLIYDPDGIASLDGKPEFYPSKEIAEQTFREAMGGLYKYLPKPKV